MRLYFNVPQCTAAADDAPLRGLSSNSAAGSPGIGWPGSETGIGVPGSSDTMEQAIEALAGPLCALMQQGHDGNTAAGDDDGTGVPLDPVMAAGCAALGRYLKCTTLFPKKHL